MESAVGQYPAGKVGRSDCLIQFEGVERHFIVYQPETIHHRPMPALSERIMVMVDELQLERTYQYTEEENMTENGSMLTTMKA